MLEGKEVISEHGAVAAEPEEAARIGAGILEAGGNAMDAASAAAPDHAWPTGQRTRRPWSAL